jgi:hypothetical protein
MRSVGATRSITSPTLRPQRQTPAEGAGVVRGEASVEDSAA